MDAVDAGLLVLRAFLGLLMVAHGSQKLLGWFNGYGVRGTGGYFASIGYPAGTLMAVLAGSVEAGGGVALAAGFLTPLVSLAFVALFVNVAWAGHGHSFWNHNQPFGVEYPLVLGVLSAVFALTGPGAYSLDAALGWTTFFGPGWFAAAILGGFAAGSWCCGCVGGRQRLWLNRMRRRLPPTSQLHSRHRGVGLPRGSPVGRPPPIRRHQEQLPGHRAQGAGVVVSTT